MGDNLTTEMGQHYLHGNRPVHITMVESLRTYLFETTSPTTPSQVKPIDKAQSQDNHMRSSFLSCS